MIFKLENTQININGKSVVKALAAAIVVGKLYKAIRKPKPKCFVVFSVDLNKEQKTSKKKQKVESE